MLDIDLDDVLTEHEQAELKAINAFLGVQTCIECGAEIEPALARLGSTTCTLHRPNTAA
jgi:hypothetical protein